MQKEKKPKNTNHQVYLEWLGEKNENEEV